MHAVLGRFFNAVLVASALVLGSGVWMIGRTARHMVQSGASFNLPLAWLVMTVLGVLMLAIFGHLRFALYPRLSRAVAGQAWPAGATALQAIRRWVLVNLAERPAMNPDAKQLWRAPRWALAVLLALLGMLGPFSIDTYLPAFSGIARSLDA
eukprot:gene18490-25187_t